MKKLLVILFSILLIHPAFAQKEIKFLDAVLTYEELDTSIWKFQKDFYGGVIMYKRVPIVDREGQPIEPVIGVVFERVNFDSLDALQYSKIVRNRSSWYIEVDSQFTLQDGGFTYPNAVGYYAHYDKGGVIHKLVIGHMVYKNIGVQIICDATEDVYSQVEKDMRRFIRAFDLRPFNLAQTKSEIEEILKTIDAQIDSLQLKAGGWPPAVESEDELAQLKQRWHKTIDELELLLKQRSDDADIEWRLGEGYRMGHNLDIEGSWERAERHLQRALTLKPDFIDAYITLGNHYVNTEPKYAPVAERLFRKALEISGPEPLYEAHVGLVFAYYYQARVEDALQQLDIVLKLKPNDEWAKEMKEVILEVKKRGQNTNK